MIQIYVIRYKMKWMSDLLEKFPSSTCPALGLWWPSPCRATPGQTTRPPPRTAGATQLVVQKEEGWQAATLSLKLYWKAALREIYICRNSVYNIIINNHIQSVSAVVCWASLSGSAAGWPGWSRCWAAGHTDQPPPGNTTIMINT